MLIRSAALVLGLLVLSNCSTDRAPQRSPGEPARGAAEADWFTDVAQASGLDFTHFNGM